jgi:hypothetical protein
MIRMDVKGKGKSGVRRANVIQDSSDIEENHEDEERQTNNNTNNTHTTNTRERLKSQQQNTSKSKVTADNFKDDIFRFDDEIEEEKELEELDAGHHHNTRYQGQSISGREEEEQVQTNFTDTCKSLNNLILQHRLLTDAKLQNRVHVRLHKTSSTLCVHQIFY